jgi:hypothetical protein
MKTVYMIAIAAVLLAAAWLWGQNSTTQNYEPARFVLLAAEVNISNVINSGGFAQNVQKSVLKLDTRTGEVWLLQAAVNGPGDPTVRSAVWAKVTNSGPFFPSGPPME